MFKELPLPREWIEATRDPLPVSEAVELRVREIWEQECRVRPGIFDGQIFSAEEINSEKVSGRFIPYRYFLAQLRAPELFQELLAHPLAISGVLTCPDGVVFGKREAALTQESGCWELLPAGGIDLTSRTATGQLDLRCQVLEEFTGEIGLTERDLTGLKPVLMMQDEVNFIIDVVFEIETPLNAAQILAAHARLTQPEHGQVKVTPAQRRSELPEEIAAHLLPASDWILSRLDARTVLGE